MKFKEYLQYIKFKNNSNKIITVDKYINLSKIIIREIEHEKENYINSKDIIKILEDYRDKILEKL